MSKMTSFREAGLLHVFRGNMYVEIIYTQLIDFWSMKD